MVSAQAENARSGGVGWMYEAGNFIIALLTNSVVSVLLVVVRFNIPVVIGDTIMDRDGQQILTVCQYLGQQGDFAEVHAVRNQSGNTYAMKLTKQQ
jgi:hypothetical protein